LDFDPIGVLSALTGDIQTPKTQAFRACEAPERPVLPTKSIAFRPIRAILEVVGLVHTEINKGFAGTF